MPSRDAVPPPLSTLRYWCGVDTDVPAKPLGWTQLRSLTGAPIGPCVFAKRKSTLRRALVKLKEVHRCKELDVRRIRRLS
ncbi:unnamed protein product, partial [Ixodes hexagonus]